MQADEHLSSAEAAVEPGDSVRLLADASSRAEEEQIEEEEGDSADDDGQLSRCHSRSVSHDSYFRLLVNNKPLVSVGHADPPLRDEEEEHVDSFQSRNQPAQSSFFDDVIYAEISKSAIKSRTNHIYTPTLS